LPDPTPIGRKCTGEDMNQVFDPQPQRLALESEILSLKARLRDLERQLNALPNPINLSASPIRRLHDDMLREIFVRCLPIDSYAFMKTSQAPLLLCRICSHWREVALTIPRLWSSIYVPYISPIDSTYIAFIPELQVRLDAISSWLSRSGGLPLSISCYINDSMIHGDENATASKDLIKLLTTFSHRWKHINLEVHPDVASSEPLRLLCASDLPILESFTITCSHVVIGVDGQLSWPSTPEGVLGAPLLRKLVVRPLHQEAGKLPIHQLTSLTLLLQSYASADILGHLPYVFAHGQNLVELSLCLAVGNPPSESSIAANIKSQVLPRLERLELSLDTASFRSLSLFHKLPKLKHLKIHTVDYQEPDPGPLGDFIASIPTLESLTIRFLKFPMDELIRALEHHTLLSHLTLWNIEPGEPFRRPTRRLIKALIVESNKPALLPNLQSLTHIYSSIGERHYKSLILSRNSGNSNTVAALTHVNICFQLAKTIDLHSELAAACMVMPKLELKYPQEYRSAFSADYALYKGERIFMDVHKELEYDPDEEPEIWMEAENDVEGSSENEDTE
ncbi:hypothetical protein AX16_005447, partial [Volvariella volvacea WC 439]